MKDEYVVNAVRALVKTNKISNLHVRIPADDLPDGGMLISCDTCDSLFLNSPNQWVKFFVRIYPTELSPAPQEVYKELGNFSFTPYDLISARIIYRIHAEYKKVIGK